MQQIIPNSSVSSFNNWVIPTSQNTSTSPVQMLDTAQKSNQAFPTRERFTKLKKDFESSFSGLSQKDPIKKNLGRLLSKLDDDSFLNTSPDDQFLNFASSLILNAGLINALIEDNWKGEHCKLIQKLKLKCQKALGTTIHLEDMIFLFNLGQEYDHENKIGLKFLCAIKLVLISPKDFKNLIFLISALMRVHKESTYGVDYELLLNLSSKVLENEPENLEVNNLLLEGFKLTGQLSEAIKLYETKKCFTTLQLLETYFICDLDINLVKTGISICKKELLLDPKNARYLNLKNLFKINFEMLKKNYKKANQLINQYLKGQKDFCDYYRVRILLDQNNAEEAYQTFYPKLSSKLFKTTIEKLTIFLLCEANQKYEEARITLATMNPHNISADTHYFTIAQCRLLTAKPETIISFKDLIEVHLSNILSVMPEYIPALLLLGKVKCQICEKLSMIEAGIIIDELLKLIQFGLSSNLSLQILALECFHIKKNKEQVKILWHKIEISLTEQDLKDYKLLLKVSSILSSHEMDSEALALYRKSLDLHSNELIIIEYFKLIIKLEDTQKCCDEIERIIKRFPQASKVDYYDILSNSYVKLGNFKKIIYYTSLSLKEKKDLYILKIRAGSYLETEQYAKAYNDLTLIFKEETDFPPEEVFSFYLQAYYYTNHFDEAFALCDRAESKLGKQTTDTMREILSHHKNKFETEEFLKNSLVDKLKHFASELIQTAEVISDDLDYEPELSKNLEVINIPLQVPVEKPPAVIDDLPKVDDFQEFINEKINEERKYLKEIYTKENYIKVRSEDLPPLPINRKFNLQRCKELAIQIRPSISYEATIQIEKISVTPIRLPVIVNHVMDVNLYQEPVTIIQKPKEKLINHHSFETPNIGIVQIPFLSDIGKDRLQLCEQRLISLEDILNRANTHYNIKDKLSSFVVSHALMYNLMKICEALYSTSVFLQKDKDVIEFTKDVNTFLISTQYIHNLRNDIRNNFSGHSVETLMEIAQSLTNSSLIKNIRKWLKFNNPNVKEGKKRKAQFLPKVPLKEFHKKEHVFDPVDYCSYELNKLENIWDKFKKDVEKEGDQLQAVKMSAAIIYKCLKAIPDIEFYLKPEEIHLFKIAANAFAHFIGEETQAGEVDEIKFGVLISLLQNAKNINQKISYIKKSSKVNPNATSKF